MKIAVVGPGGVGKDMLSEFIAQKYGLQHVSSGDILREIAVEKGLPFPDRIALRKIGKEIRDEYGNDITVRRAVLKYPDNLILSGLRTYNEAKSYIDLGGMIIALDAPLDLRYEWLKDRNDRKDAGLMSYEDFVLREEAEAENIDPNAQNISAVMKLASFTIVNNKTKEELFEECSRIIDENRHHNLQSPNI